MAQLFLHHFLDSILCDHTIWIANNHKDIDILDENSQPIPLDEIKRHDAWIITNILWNRYKDSDEKVESYEIMSQRLVDIMHSIGTSTIGLIITFILWLYFHLTNIKLSHSAFHYPGLIIWIVIIIVFFVNFFNVKKKLEVTSNSILSEIISDKHQEYNKKVKFHYIRKKIKQ